MGACCGSLLAGATCTWRQAALATPATRGLVAAFDDSAGMFLVCSLVVCSVVVMGMLACLLPTLYTSCSGPTGYCTSAPVCQLVTFAVALPAAARE